MDGTNILENRTYYLIGTALVLPLYDFLLAFLLGRTPLLEFENPLFVVASLLASLSFFIFLKESWKIELKVTALLSIAIALVVPLTYVTIGVEFGERPLLYILPTAVGTLLGLIEKRLKNENRYFGLIDLRDNRSTQIGILHTVLALEMFIISWDIKLGEVIASLIGGNILMIFLVFIMLPVLLSLNFFIASAPIHFYREKDLKAPLAVFVTWLGLGVTSFFLNWNSYPVTPFHGGLRLFPPQPDYLLRPWIPLILIITTWKHEEKILKQREQK